MTEDQRELIAHLIDLLDQDEKLNYAALFGMPEDPEWEQRMNAAAQELSEEFPSRK